MSLLNNHDLCSAEHLVAQGAVKPKSNVAVGVGALLVTFACCYLLLTWLATAVGPTHCRHAASIEYAACSLLHGDETQREAAKQIMAILGR